MKPSTKSVQEYLFTHGSITGLEALRKLGCFRLSARILELRQIGMQIETTYITQRQKRFAKYSYYAT